MKTQFSSVISGILDREDQGYPHSSIITYADVGIPVRPKLNRYVFFARHACPLQIGEIIDPMKAPAIHLSAYGDPDPLPERTGKFHKGGVRLLSHNGNHVIVLPADLIQENIDLIFIDMPVGKPDRPEEGMHLGNQYFLSAHIRL